MVQTAYKSPLFFSSMNILFQFGKFCLILKKALITPEHREKDAKIPENFFSTTVRAMAKQIGNAPLCFTRPFRKSINKNKIVKPRL